MGSAARFVRDFAAYSGRRGLLAAAAVMAGALLEGLGLALIIPLLGVVIGGGGAGKALQRYAGALFRVAGVEGVVPQLALLLGLFGLLMIVRAVVISRRDVLLAELQVGFIEAQRGRVAERLANARWDQVARLRHARISHVISGDVQRIGAAAHVAMQSAISLTMLLAQCALAFALSPPLALVAFVLLAAGAVAMVPVLGRARRLGAVVTGANLQLLETTTRFLGGLKLAISQNLQAGFVSEFRATLNDLATRQIEYPRQQTFGRLALTTLSALVGAALVLTGFGVFHIAPPVLITLLLIISRMSGPAGQIQQGAQQLAHALPAYEKVKELEAELEALPGQGDDGGGERPFPEGAVVFEGVSFRHADDQGEDAARGVEDLSLVIAAGEFVGLAGPSGAGKTTFADLLVGLYPPQSGRIAVGGEALEGRMLSAWRRGVSYISQDSFLFHDSIRRNLAWANPAASEAEMWDALARAGAEVLVRRMDQGLDTVAGERGALVSGGERQRIALARALLRRPRLLVLDEATSAIDLDSERAILQRLLGLEPRPTMVMIAHRPESLAFCERLLRLENGRLAFGA